MAISRSKTRISLLLAGLACLLCLGLASGGVWTWFNLRPQPGEADRVLFPGVTYLRQTRREPRPMVIHVVTVNLREPGVSLLVTPGDPNAEMPLKARTTSRFLEEFGVQIAVNGDAFSPWYSNNIFDYYPRPGDPVSPVGFAASQGTVYSSDTDAEPTLYISRTGQARFNTPGGRAFNAISGNLMLIEKGQSVFARNERKPKDEKARNKPVMDEPLPEGQDAPQPRTALALDKSGRRLILVVVDGRQPSYSQGATLAELAEILLANGGYTGMNLDGGGSTTLVMEGRGRRPVILNSPVDQRIPGRERPVGNHLGVFAGVKD